MDNKRSELRWGVEQRLEFIEFRLFWEGTCEPKRPDDPVWGFCKPSLYRPESLYRLSLPSNMVYDKSARTYVRGTGFKPQFLEPDASRYLAQLRSVADGILDREDSWIADLPPHASVPTPGARRQSGYTRIGRRRHTHRAEAIEVKYQSLSNPEPRWRWIAPHAVAFDGFRWHTRAFCLTDEALQGLPALPHPRHPRVSRESGFVGGRTTVTGTPKSL